MKYYEMSERDLKVLMRTMGEAMVVLEKHAQHTRLCFPQLPNGDLALSTDSPTYQWLRRAEISASDIRSEIAYLTSMYFDRRGHCANYNGPERRGIE